jgi:hydroxypyruvate isomerase
MVRLSVVPWGFFPDASLAEAMEQTAAAGADAVEVLGRDGHTPGEIGDMAADHGIEVATLSAAGETPGIDNVSPAVVDPDSVEQSVEELTASVEDAAAADAHTLLMTVGQGQDDLAPHEHHVTLVEVLRRVAPTAESEGVTVVPEILNTRVDHPGYYLSTSHEAYEIVHAVDSPEIRVLYDIYHQQITEGNVLQNLRENLAYVGHMHFADVPGRHEPGTGELNYDRIFDALDEAGYDGFLGCELTPTGDPEAVLADVVEMAQ